MALQKLFDIIARLRGPDGCPWDQAQRPEDILSDLIEEAYEMQWAYANGTREEVLDETGDVVFVLTFAIMLLQEKYPEISLESLAQHAHDKIYRRHPHVFGNATATSREEGLAHWESMKAQERDEKATDTTTPFDDIPRSLPPLRRAEKIQTRAARSGFDWDNPHDIIAKIREEIEEITPLLKDQPREEIEEEVGDLFFSVSNLARFLHVDSEKALNDANAKFVRRYNVMVELATADAVDFDALSLQEKETYWQRAKSQE